MRENLIFQARYFGVAAARPRRERIEELLEFTLLRDRADERIWRSREG